MQTILGSGGAIGIPLARELKKYTDHIRLVSRNPKKVNDTDELLPIDMYDFSRIEKAVSGSEVVYVTVGFKYNIYEWRKVWPQFMKAVIEACIKHNARLVFFDNMYMYAKSSLHFMTEEARIDPPSEKGRVRAQIHEMIFNATGKNQLWALIVRSADFYGPECTNSALKIMVADNLARGKKAQVFGNMDKIHTYTFTPDAAQATAILGNTKDVFNQVWHVPTTREKLTTYDWIRLISKELNKKAKIQNIPTWMIHVLGIFIPVMREFPEMIYQNENDYIFDSSKFEKRFGIIATRPETGIRRMIESMRL
jgi:nucleoside-diphosphate-sugar epimerase